MPSKKIYQLKYHLLLIWLWQHFLAEDYTETLSGFCSVFQGWCAQPKVESFGSKLYLHNYDFIEILKAQINLDNCRNNIDDSNY